MANLKLAIGPGNNSNPRLKYREQWLAEGLELLKRQVFGPNKYKVSPKIQVSCGFPHSRAFSPKAPVIGECWYPQKSDTHHLFISPVLADPVRVLDVLTHEVVHTIAGSKAKHGSGFKYVATRVGLTGKMTATVAGPQLAKLLEHLSGILGDYPHTPLSKPRKVKTKTGPTTIKAICSCGYCCSVPIRWVEEVGYPLCPTCREALGPRLDLLRS